MQTIQGRLALRGVPLIASLLLCQVAMAIDIGTSAAHRNQHFDAWGMSLSWAGNVVGGFSDGVRTELVERMFEPANNLGFTFTRYNIGGGQDPIIAQTNNSRPGSWVPGWVPGTVAPQDIETPAAWEWDWQADPRQRLVLDEAIALGVRETEAFILSPPHWMTISGDTAGGVVNQTNLELEHFDEYAHYMTEVVRHFDENLGIHFETLSPMNESAQGWWRTGLNQEGMNVPRGFHQRVLIERAGEALAAKGLSTTISATDEFNAIGSIQNWQQLNSYTKSFVSTISTHVYNQNAISDLTALRDIAAAEGKRLIVSEYGNGGNPDNGGDLGGGLRLASRITADLNHMQVAAWTYWQGLEQDHSSRWGLVRVDMLDENGEHVVSPQYHAMRQFTSYIRPGSYILDTADKNETVAAYDPKSDTTSIVVSRDGSGIARDFELLDQSVTFSRVIQTSPTDQYRSYGAADINGSTVSQFAGEDTVTTIVLHHRPNLIQNAEFIYDGGSESVLNAGWQASENAGFSDRARVSNGPDIGAAALRTDVNGGTGRIFQDGIGAADKNLTGVAFEFSVDALFTSAGAGGDDSMVSIGFEFLGADGQTLVHASELDYATKIDPDVDDFVHRVYRTPRTVAPHGTRFVRPVMRFENASGDSADGWVFFDNGFMQELDYVPRGREWTADVNGVVGDNANWRLDTLKEHNSHAYFGYAITANRAVTIDGVETFSGVTFDSAHSYTLSGPGQVVLDGGTESALLDARGGGHRLVSAATAATDVVARVLPGAALTLSQIDLSGHELHSQGAGLLTLGSGFTISGGVLRVDLAASPTISISGSATLDGLLVINLPVGHAVEIGETYAPIVVLGGPAVFEGIALPHLDAGQGWDVLFSPSSLTLEVIQRIAGDFNFDGVVDAADYTVWRDSDLAVWTPALDADQNGVLNVEDLAVWRTNFGLSLSGLTQSVPEPSALMLIAFVAVLAPRRPLSR